MLRVLVANGLCLAGMAFMLVSGTEQRATPLVAASPDAPFDLAALEQRAAAEPSAPSVTALASAYLDREQPGLASAVLDRAPGDLRARPEIAVLRARAMFHRGHAREALAVAREASASCADGACPTWIEARAARQVAFFEEVVAAGVDDPQADPRATRAAYERSTRAVRLVAMR
jgi:hypothetical protein